MSEHSEVERLALAERFANEFPAALSQYSQFKIVDWFLAALRAARREEPVGWTTKRNIECLRENPRHAVNVWGEQGTVASVALYAHPAESQGGGAVEQILRDHFYTGEPGDLDAIKAATKLLTSSSPAALPMREAIARVIYDAEPYYEPGESVDGFQVSPGGNLSWEQAKDRDAEFGDDPIFIKLTAFPYRCADVILALTATESAEPQHGQVEGGNG